MGSRNLYQMYYDNGKTFGYYVIRDGWSQTIAKVVSIEGISEGDEIPGKPPYHGTPKTQPKVIAEFFNGDDPSKCGSLNFKNKGPLRCPSTFGYEEIEFDLLD